MFGGESEVFQGYRSSLWGEGIDSFQGRAGQGGSIGFPGSAIGTIGDRWNRFGNEDGAGAAGRGGLQVGWEEGENFSWASACLERQDCDRERRSDFGWNGSRSGSFG